MAEEKKYADIRDVPTDLLAHNFVGTLILAKGNVNKWDELTKMLIRGLRGEPDQPPSHEDYPGHVASETDPKICGRCGIHIDELRP